MSRNLPIIILGLAMVAIASSRVSADDKGLVVVAGATGRTGRLVVKNLIAEGYKVRAMVRSLEKGKQVFGEEIAMVQADVTEPSTLPPLLAGAEFVISSIGVSGKGEARPEDVDYGGSVALIDASKSARIKKFIMVTSGGVTWWTHPINWFSGGVLKWKRKAELYLRASGLTHVIVRPNGGLTDKPGNLKKIIFTQNDGFPSSISREDVAIVCVKALEHKEANNKTFEVRNGGDGLITSSVDWAKTFSEMVVQSDNF
ncbi:MAG: SDR family oxidoreductase [Deltaproteobacteria bacterium]|nr:SDR family oxidoreductase [Deltaproteobacteria bacterium]